MYGCDDALGGTALNVRMAVLRVVSKVELLPVAGEVSWRKYSPGRRSVLPYTSSAALHCRSVLSAVRIPRRTTGRVSIQCEGNEWALRADLSCRWKRSIIPFAIGW